MFDVTQVITKKISLPKGWSDNNYEGYSKYITEAHSLQQSISEMLRDDNIEVVNIDMELNIHIKTKDPDINTSDLIEHITLEVQDKIEE